MKFSKLNMNTQNQEYTEYAQNKINPLNWNQPCPKQEYALIAPKFDNTEQE